MTRLGITKKNVQARLDEIKSRFKHNAACPQNSIFLNGKCRCDYPIIMRAIDDAFLTGRLDFET